MTRRWLSVVVVCASVSAVLPATLALGSVAGASATPPAAASPVAPVAVPVTVRGGQGAPGGAEPIVKVRVGTSNAVPVFLDTGSSGLHIFADAVATGSASGVTVTSGTSDITYAGGERFTGVVATAVVRVGPESTTGPVPFALVNQASCRASKPSCPAAGGISGYESTKGVYGILGIGTQSSQGNVISPLLGMPGGLANSWSLRLGGSTGALVLGATAPPGSPAVASFPMESLGTVTGRPLWDDSKLLLCVAVGSTQACTHGLFDSGTASFEISGPVLGQAPTAPGTGQVVSGLPVSVTQLGAGSPFWTFTTGTAKSLNLVRRGPERRSFVNTGVGVFYDFSVLYNDVAGTVSLYH